MLEYALFLTMSQPAPVIGQVIPSGLLYSYAKKADTKSPSKEKTKIKRFNNFPLSMSNFQFNTRRKILVAKFSVSVYNLIYMNYQEKGSQGFEHLLQQGGVRLRREGKTTLVEISNVGIDKVSHDGPYPYSKEGYKPVNLETGQIVGSNGHTQVSEPFLAWAKEKASTFRPH